MKSIHSMIVLFAAVILILVQASAAAAAPPSNDTFGGATAVSPGFSETLNTTEATTDADDTQLGAFCGIPLDASVWYSFTTSTSHYTEVRADSDYSNTLFVGVGTEGNLSVVTGCVNGFVSFFAQAGTTYYVLVVDNQFDGGGNGGTLQISFTQPTAPTVDLLTIDKFGTFDSKLGSAQLTGTYACSNADSIHVFGDIRQDIGRIASIRGTLTVDPDPSGTCDGNPRPWSATVLPQGGNFSGGKVLAVVNAFDCTFTCGFEQTIRTVQLRGGT